MRKKMSAEEFAQAVLLHLEKKLPVVYLSSEDVYELALMDLSTLLEEGSRVNFYDLENKLKLANEDSDDLCKRNEVLEEKLSKIAEILRG